MSSPGRARILHCIGSLNRGGAQRQLALLLRHCRPESFRYGVLYLDDDVYGTRGDDPATRLPAGVDRVHVPRGRRRRLLDLDRRIRQAVADYRPDLVQLWLPELVMIPAGRAARRLGVPIISSQRRSMLTLRDRLKYIPHLMADRIVANFEVGGESAFFRRLFARKSGLVIPNGLDLESIRALASESFELPRPGPRLLYVGRLAQQKRLDLAIGAVARLRQAGTAVSLLVVGDGPDEMRRRLEREAEANGVADSVHFLGYRSHWTRFAGEADAFVLPSESEGMPNALLEAAAGGLPVVAADLPEVRWIFTDGTDARLFESGSVVDLTRVLADLLADTAAQRRLAAAGLKLAESFSVERLAESWAALYEQLLTSAEAGRPGRRKAASGAAGDVLGEDTSS